MARRATKTTYGIERVPSGGDTIEVRRKIVAGQLIPPGVGDLEDPDAYEELEESVVTGPTYQPHQRRENETMTQKRRAQLASEGVVTSLGDGGEPVGSPVVGDPPPKAGAGSGTEEWRAHAEEHGLDVPEAASRDEIIGLVETHVASLEDDENDDDDEGDED